MLEVNLNRTIVELRQFLPEFLTLVKPQSESNHSGIETPERIQILEACVDLNRTIVELRQFLPEFLTLVKPQSESNHSGIETLPKELGNSVIDI